MKFMRKYIPICMGILTAAMVLYLIYRGYTFWSEREVYEFMGFAWQEAWFVSAKSDIATYFSGMGVLLIFYLFTFRPNEEEN